MLRRWQFPLVSWVARLMVVGLAIAAIAGMAVGWMRIHAHRFTRDHYEVTDVRRADLHPSLMAGGRVESGKKTIIECQLENFSVGVQGQRLAAGGASVLLKLIPEGTLVKKGDVLAVLDSSEYEELVRLQRMTVERARADKLQAELDHEIARLALEEYRDGSMKEMVEDFQRRIILARSDLERAQDRRNWSRTMKDKGYVSASTLSTDEYTVAQLAHTLQQEEGAFSVFQKYTAPRTIRTFEGDIIAAQTNLSYQALRCQRHVDRLATLEKQVDLCTIRAPHDGYVIYANDARRQVFIEEGLPVRQNQKLFYLPDLNNMEVIAMLNESVVNEVRAGMTATVRVEGMPNRSVEGRVTAVAQLAVLDWRTDARYFEGVVKLDNPPVGLKPGMTAQVELTMPSRENVLAVPSEAVTLDEGRNICFVVHDEGLERRPVKLGQVTLGMTEVTDGLHEGEQVVVNPRPEEADLLDPAEGPDLASKGLPSAPESEAGEVAAFR